MSTVATLQEIIGALRATATAADETAGTVESSAQRIKTAVQEVQQGGERIDDFRHDMQRLAEEGNAWAGQAAAAIDAVREGIVPASAAVHAFGDGVTIFEGQVRRVADVMNDVLPTTGQVQKQIRELVEDIKNSGDILGATIERLSTSSNQYTRELAHILDLFRQGRASLERVQQALAQAQKVLPGSETAQLAQLVDGMFRQGSGG